MELNDRQLERLARRLDGEAVEPDEPTRSAERAFRRDEAYVAGLLDASPPTGAMERVRSRIEAELPPSRPSVLRMFGAGAGWAAAAAAVVVLAVTITATDRSVTVTTARGAEDEAVPLTVLLEASEESVETTELELLEAELGDFTADLAALEKTTSYTDGQIDLLQSDVEEFWLRDPGAEYMDL
ncbi:MAG: hypothetical protein ACLFVW_08490 [Phycisphaerae bacterium]